MKQSTVPEKTKSAFSVRPIEHRDAEFIAYMITRYTPKSKYRHRKVSEERLIKMILACVAGGDNIGLLCESEDGKPMAMFMGGVSDHAYFEGKSAHEYCFGVSPKYRRQMKELTKALICVFEDWAKSKQAKDITYLIRSGIPGKNLEQVFDETSYDRFGYCAMREI